MDVERLRTLKAEKRFDEAFSLYRQLLALGEGTAEVCLIGGQAAKALGNWWAAEEALELCLDLEPTETVLGIARYVIGVNSIHLGKLENAVRYLTDWLEGITEYEDLGALLLGSVYFNRGLAHRMAGRFEEALCDYSEACEADGREGMTENLLQDLINLAWVACLFGDSVHARKSLEQARPLCTRPVDKWHLRVGEAFLQAIDSSPLDRETIPVCQRMGLEMCMVVINHDGADVPKSVLSHAHWLAGRLYLDLGDPIAAERHCYQALHFGAEAQNDARCLYDAADLLKAIRQVYAPQNPVQGA